VTESLPKPLRMAQIRAIFGVLSSELRTRLEKIMINPDHIPESPAHRRLRLLLEEAGEKRGRAEGEVKGRAESLLVILEARGLPVSPKERASILACTDPEQLTVWTRQALSATSVSQLLPLEPSRSAPRTSRPRRRAPANSG